MKYQETRDAIRRSLEREDPGCVNWHLYIDPLPVMQINLVSQTAAIVKGPLQAPQEIQNKLRNLIRGGGSNDPA